MTNRVTQQSGLCLVAISGDCADGGMGSSNQVLPFRPEHNDLVKTYLEAQLDFHMHCTFSSPGDKQAQTLYQRLNDAGHTLRDAGVFHHKYHARTDWELAYMNELNDISRYKPFRVVYPKPQTEEDN
jgi:hypothetical protein